MILTKYDYNEHVNSLIERQGRCWYSPTGLENHNSSHASSLELSSGLFFNAQFPELQLTYKYIYESNSSNAQSRSTYLLVLAASSFNGTLDLDL
jgi:hypothetical protein